jgi:hypothetical protein
MSRGTVKGMAQLVQVNSKILPELEAVFMVS